MGNFTDGDVSDLKDIAAGKSNPFVSGGGAWRRQFGSGARKDAPAATPAPAPQAPASAPRSIDDDGPHSLGDTKKMANGGMVGKKQAMFENSGADKEPPGMREGSKREEMLDRAQMRGGVQAPKVPNPTFAPFGKNPGAKPA